MADVALAPLRDRLVLVVADEYLVADDLCRELEGVGARVLGPAPSVAAALALLAGTRPDAAILDVNVAGECVTAVADGLAALCVPFVLVTGYDGWALPPSLAAASRCEKPVDLASIARALFVHEPG